MMKKLFSLFVALFVTTALWAHDFEVNGIYYNYRSGNNVEVTYKGSDYSSYYDEYSGDVIIPSTVTYNGTTYSVTSVSHEAFRGCSSLTSVTMPNSVVKLGGGVFYDCDRLKSVTLSASITSLPTYVVTYDDDPDELFGFFANCSSLESIVIPEGVTTIGDKAFESCTSLKEIILPNTVTNLGKAAFYSCSKLRSVTLSENITSLQSAYYVAYWDEVYAVYGCFSACSSLESIRLPKSITRLEKETFYGCNSLKSVHVESTNPSQLEDDVFSSSPICYVPCGAREKYEQSIWAQYVNRFVEEGDCPVDPAWQITYTSSDGNIVTPNNADVFGANMVSNVYKNGTGVITLDGPVTSIGNDAFYGCSSLTSVTIPNSVTSIGMNAFYNCSSLYSINIPNNLTSIGDGAFVGTEIYNNRTNWKNDVLYISDCLIEADPFYISGIYTIKQGTRLIADDAFAGCRYLTSVIIPNGVTTIGGGAFQTCYALTSITIPNSVMSIGEFAFHACNSLTSITIPNGVTCIRNYVFQSCNSLTSITIPNSVASIGDYAFRLCSLLDTIHVEAPVPPTLGYSVFDNTPASFCYIPCGTKSAYEASDWAQYMGEFVEEGCVDSTRIITYTSSDGNIVTPYKSNAFGVNIVSNTYENGVGTITFDAPVTSIGDYAFFACSSLTSITIPNSVTSIEYFAFYDCSSLTSVTIPNSVTSIGNSVFNGCSKLTSVTIGNSVTSIGSTAFARCSKLTSITIPNSVTSIGSNAFSYCSSLTSITIPNSVTSIEGNAFSGCSKLTSVVWNAKNCADSNYSPFSDICSQITSFTFGDNVEHIPASLCYGMKNLKSITIPNNVTSIGNEAFSYCSSLTSITIPNSVTSIGKYAFEDCSSLTSVVWNAKNCADFSSSSYAPFDDIRSQITSFTFGDSVEHIPASLCYGMKNLKSITIPNSVTSIGKEAFSYCSSLTSITIPNGVTSIENYAFSGCSKLTSITIPNSVTSIEYRAFSDCSSLTSITIPNSVTSIGNLAFSGCSSLTSVVWNAKNCADFSSPYYSPFGSQITSFTFGDSVEHIPASLCYGMKNLKSITIPNSVTSIGEKAFFNCNSSLISINVDKSNSKYDSRDNCNAIIETATNTLIIGCKNTIIPNGVTSIENYAFYSCSSLTSITIPNSVTSIGYSSFSDCSSLTSITIPNSVTSIGGSAFSNCSSLTSLTIPNSLTSIGDYAFYRCSSLTSVTIPNSVTSIGEEAFNGCYRLTSVTIGNSVTSIGYSAFAGCRPDTMIIKAPTPPSLYTDAFTASIPICVIPCGTLAAYQASDWAQYVGEFVEEGCVDSTRIITYTSTDGNIVVPYYEYAFGANIVSNTYENGVGTITFDAPITRIGYGAFSYCSSLTSITIPNSVTWIGEKAFSDCSSLTSVTIPNGITSIDDYAFRSCKTLTSITIPNSVTSIGNDAFAYCSSLTSITIPESVMSIGDQAFYYCEALTSITIPNSVTSIGSDTFRSCSSLTSVTIGNSVTSIGDQAFAYCFSLTSINIPNSVTSIGNDAFSDCSSLTSVTIPNSVTSIGARAFSGCTFIKDNFVNNSSLDAVTNNYWGAKIADIELDGLLIRNDTVIDCRQSVTMVVIPDYITCIGNYAFSDCSSLTSVTIPNSVTSIGIRAFSRCSSLTSVSIPNSVISIGEVAFDGTAIYHDEANWESGVLYISNCLIEAKEDILSYYAIKENTRILANSAFRFCSSLTSITIPESVTGIGENAFQYCTSLKSITCEAIEPPTVGDYTFGSVPTSIPVYVPCGRVETYKATPLWNNFSNIQEPLAEYSIIVDVNDNAMGIVEVNNSACGCQISAIPNAGYRFVEWSDGNTDNPRSLELTQNTSLVANFEIIILTPDTATICYGDTYQWNDRTYDASGTYYDTLSTGLATLHLTVLPAVEETVQDVSICEGSTYTWKADGKVYSESGNYSITVQDVNGCDSVVTLHLTVNSLVITEETIIACDSYEWNDETYTESGDYTYTTTAANGCDSIVTLHLTINQTQYVEETVTACDSYEWNGETYTESGDYTYTTTAANGCDSIITLHLTFNKTQYVEETVTACDSYTWNGEIYNESGEYVYTTTAANGCDSIVTLHLTINKTQYAEVTATACDSYVWNGETYTTSGEYTYTTTAANGCDSIVTLHLTINKSSVSSEEHATICYGETYIWNGQAYATSGDYSVILSNVAGCDSVATLHLTVMPEAVTTTETIIIGSDALPYIWRDKEYSSTGRYSDIEQYTSVACDSAIHYLDLTVLTTGNLDEQSATICETELPYIWYDQSLTESGKYTYTEQYVGTTIDSVQHILNLIIIPTTYTTEDVIINIGESYTWHGATYDETGEYSVTLSNVAGCDSIVTLHLTVVSTIYYTSTDGNVVTPYNPNAFDVNIISNTYENGQGIIILDGPVTMIGSDAFYNCSTLASIDIPNGVVSIKKGAFQGCSALTSIAIPDGVTCVERQSFYKCEALKTIHLSNTLESIGSYAFCHCISLEAIDIPEGVTMIDECTFYNCPSLASISMGDAITRIGKSAFFNCTSLTSVDIPNSVTCIAGSAFSSCVGLTAITIPHAVTSIGNKAFYNCHSFSSITNEAIVPPVIEGGDSTFLNVSKSIPVYVPCSTVDAYKAAYLWSNFTNIQEPLPTYSINVDVNDNAMGIVEVNNSACGCQISAIPNAGYRFVEWSDGNIDNPRSLELTQNTSLVANFEIIILTPDTATICYGDTYQWNDRTYDVTGTYYDTLSTGLATLHLTVLPAVEETIHNVSICQGNTYTWQVDGQVYSESGIYSITLQDVNGCDSVVTLHLIVKPSPSIKNAEVSVCAFELPYEWFGMEIWDSGTYTTSQPYSSIDCDSIVYNLTFVVLPEHNLTISAEDTNMGDVFVSIWPTCPDNEAEFEAIPNEGYRFSYWSDGSKENPRTMVLNQDTTITAIFREKVVDCENITASLYLGPLDNQITPTDDWYELYFYEAKDNNKEYRMIITNSSSETVDVSLEGFASCEAVENAYDYSNTLAPQEVIMVPFDYTPFDICYLHAIATGDVLIEWVPTDCGENLYWDYENEHLRISGYGDMYEYTFLFDMAPWLSLPITQVTLPNGITSIGEFAFFATGITSIEIPSAVTKIGDGAFGFCVNLSSVVISEQVNTIGMIPFVGCYQLTSMVVDEGNTIFDSRESCNALIYTASDSLISGCRNSTIPESVIKIGNYAFAGGLGDDNEESIVFPEYLDTIHEAITIPTSVTSISEGAFMYSYFDTLYMETGVPANIDTTTFFRTNPVCYIPCGTLETYRSSDWNDHVEYFEEYMLYTLTVDVVNPLMGSVEIQQTPTCTTDATIAAIPSMGYQFVQWNDGNTDNPRTFTLTQDTILTASFMYVILPTDSASICQGETYTWNGKTYNEAGEYVDTISSGIATLYLTIFQNEYEEYTEIACDEYTWHGTTYTESGTYTYNTTTEQGCDRVETLHLTINYSEYIEETDTACDEYTWHGTTYTESGTYTYTTTTEQGCDRVETLHLTINYSGQVEESVTACDSYVWNGETYTASGDYVYTTTATNGCDSIVTLHLTINETQYTEESITACDSYAWNGETYTASGDYVYTTTAANGCDSIVTLHLTINQTQYAEESVTACDSYAWNGETYTESGEYVYSTVAANGCDSIVTLHLTINQSEVGTTEYVTICYGETYTWNGQTYSATGEYSVILSNALGCDSVTTLSLTMMPEAITTTETVVIGSDELPYTWRGNTYATTGRYTDVEQYAAVACDSAIHVLDLTILVADNYDEQSVTICDSETPYLWYGEAYSATGKYTYTEQYAGTDIDSVQHILNLTVNLTKYTEESVVACDSYAWNSETYTASGDYTYTTTAKNGCDSIVTLHLTINKTQYAEVEATACDSYDWNGKTYTESGEYTYTTTAKNGCDSIVTLHLTINKSEVGTTEYALICYGETYTWHGQTYSATDEYSVTLSNVNGCDSVATLRLTVMPKAVSDTLIAIVGSDELPYLWRGKEYASTGIYTIVEQYATVACDSAIHVLDLTVLSAGALDEQSATICETELPYIWYNQELTQSGKYTYTEQYIGTDIDSIQHILNLTVNPTIYVEETVAVCDSYVWNGETYTTSGEYTYTTTAKNGCDSIVTLHLTINKTQYAEETVTACDSYTWNGETYTTSGGYTYTTTAKNGCDSILTLHLTINKTQYAEVEATACDSYAWNGETYTTSGEYTYTTTTAAGCERIEVLHLTINKSEREEYTEVACDEYVWHGMTYTESGDYTFNTTTDQGCERVEVLHLTISKSEYVEETVTACDSYEWNGATYTESGNYTYTTTTAAGCERIEVLHLTINKSEREEYTEVACDEYVWHGVTYTESGDYTYTTTTDQGCERIEVLHLTILSAATTEYEELVLCSSELPYDWYGQTLTEPGNYTASEQYTGMECDSVVHELTLNIYTQTLPSSVTLPIVRMGEAIDVSVPTAEIQAHIAADTWYAPDALIAWYILDNSNWATLTDEPVSSGINEVVMKYAVDSDCGSVESDRIIIPVETTGVENIPTDEMGVYKVVRDNQIFIIRGGKIYSIVGHTIENGMSIGL